MNRLQVAVLGLLAMVSIKLWAAPTQAASTQYDRYVATVEQRIERDRSIAAGLDADANAAKRLLGGELVVDRIAPKNGDAFPGAMLHHWRARAFVAGTNAAEVDRVLRDVQAYPRIYAPQVERAHVMTLSADRMRTSMRVKQKHVLTVVLDTDYDVLLGHLNASSGWSWARSTRVAEISDADSAHERTLAAGEDHGFLWRQNTYWKWTAADGGVYLEIESISLTRSIPTGLGWAVRPFVESVPRESLEFTLRATAAALQHK